MKIFSILVYHPEHKELVSAALTPHYAYDLETEILPPAIKAYEQKRFGMGVVIKKNYVFYIQIAGPASKEPIMIFAVNESMPEPCAQIIFTSIAAKKEKEALEKILSIAEKEDEASQKILNNSMEKKAQAVFKDSLLRVEQEQVSQKINNLQSEALEVREITIGLIEKLIHRNEKLDAVDTKILEMKKQTELFREESKKLKKSLYCPNMFWLFTFAHRKFWREPVDYYFYPANKPK